MADNRRAGERTIFRGDVEVGDTLAEISQALEKERRTPIAAVDAGFVPPVSRPASNIPAMADLEEELLREFALYEGPDEARATSRRVEPSFASPSAPPVEPAAPAPQSDDDDDTMPPVDMAPLFRASRATPVVQEFASKPRVEPAPPSVFETDRESAIDFAPEAPLAAQAPLASRPPVAASAAEPASPVSEVRPAVAEPDVDFDFGEPLLGARQPDPALDLDTFDDEPLFDGPVPDLLADAAEEASLEPEAAHAALAEEPIFAGPVPDFDFDDEPAFSGPVPDLDLDLDDEPAFSGPVPDMDLDDEPAFAGPVPDLDLSEPDAEDVSAVAAASLDDELAGELELSVGALDLQPETVAEPVSPFAAWKNDRLSAPIAGDAVPQPVWHSAAAGPLGSIPEADDVAAMAPVAAVAVAVETDAFAVEEALAHQAPEAEADAALDFDIELDAEDLLDPVEPLAALPEASPALQAPSMDAFAGLAPAAASADAYVAPVVPTEPARRDDLQAEKPTVAIAPVVAAMTPVAAAVATPAMGAALDLPDWLQPSRRPSQPAQPEVAAPVAAAATEDEDLFKDFEFNFDDDAIEAEVSRAVMSELQAGTVPPEPAVAEEPPFDPSQITEIEERIPTSLAKLDVPQIPEHEGDAVPKPVSDFDYDIEAEMAELFAMGNKPKAQADAVEPVRNEEQDGDAQADAFDQGFANEIIRSIHETPAIPAGRAFDIAQTNGASTSFVARYAKLAAMAALVAFAGVAAIMLWRSGDVPGLATDGTPRVIMADKAPVKEVPENPGGKQVPNQDKAVYDRVSGKSAEVVKQGSLIATSEEPVNVAEKTLGSDPGSVDQSQVPGVSEDGSDARLPASPSQSSAAQQSNEAVAPRKVKTMIVLPNGTLVARETPAPDNAKPDPTTANAAEATPLAAPGATNAPSGQTLAGDAATAQPADAAANAAAAPADQARQIAAPVPVPRPAEQPVNVVGTVTQRGNVVAPEAEPAQKVASAAAKPAAAPTASSVPAGTYVIQIASLPSQEEAQKSYSNLSGKFASVIGGRSVDIKPAEIAGKGTYYRVRIVAGSRDDAIALCTRYKAAGGSCLVSR